jgi:hypothetical protein
MPQAFEVSNIFEKPGDDKRVAIFYVKPVSHPAKSLEAGYPVFEDKIYCRHQEVGDNTTIHDQPVTDDLKRRYRQAWAMFEAGRGGEHIGMPLSLLFADRPSLVLHLQAHGVHTVEELAKLGAEGQRQIGMGADMWQKQADKFLAQAKDTAAITKANAELAKRDEKIDALTKQVEKLMESMARQFTADPVAEITAARSRKPRAAPFSTEPEPELADEEVI